MLEAGGRVPAGAPSPFACPGSSMLADRHLGHTCLVCAGHAIRQMTGVLAELDRRLIAERTPAGRTRPAAVARGLDGRSSGGALQHEPLHSLPGIGLVNRIRMGSRVVVKSKTMAASFVSRQMLKVGRGFAATPVRRNPSTTLRTAECLAPSERERVNNGNQVPCCASLDLTKGVFVPRCFHVAFSHAEYYRNDQTVLLNGYCCPVIV
jgi:hypothetical protein